MNVTWFLVPMVFAVSLVWNASRYEDSELIISRTIRMFLQIMAFMIVLLLILAGLSYNL